MLNNHVDAGAERAHVEYHVMDKNIQIQILGVPAGWVKHQRSGRWVTWKHPTAKDYDLHSLESPMQGMDARLINNQWY